MINIISLMMVMVAVMVVLMMVMVMLMMVAVVTMMPVVMSAMVMILMDGSSDVGDADDNDYYGDCGDDGDVDADFSMHCQ